MKNFIRTILTGAAFCLVLNFISVPAKAQTPPAAASDTIQPVTIQAPEPAAAAPQPGDNVQLPQGTEPQPEAAAKPAKAKKAVKHHVKRKAKHHAKKKPHAKSKKAATSSLREHVRTAQSNLDTLGYNPGPIDGLSGPKTRAAIKAFQSDHKLRVTGKLDRQTFDLLAQEVLGAVEKKQATLSTLQEGGNIPPAPQPPPDFFANNPDYYGSYDREYANPNMMGSPQAIPTRFGDMQVSDQLNGTTHQYVITLNGQPVFHANGQPAVINLSRTFNLDAADAIVLTSYATGDNICPYRHYLLVVRLNSNGVHEITNCTRAFEAYVQSGSLYISFPGEHVDGWASGDTWRYENGTLQKL